MDPRTRCAPRRCALQPCHNGVSQMSEVFHDGRVDARRTITPARNHESCARCNGPRVQGVMMTRLVVYLRCEGCGEVWSIPQRRKAPRTDDPRRL